MIGDMFRNTKVIFRNLYMIVCLHLDLPTAEELMRPIRPENEQIRGFTLQPVRLGLQKLKII